jgi:hypothetical protein
MNWTCKFGTFPLKLVGEQISARRRLSKIASRMGNNYQRVLNSQEASRRDNPASESTSSSRGKPESLADDPND